MATSDTRSLETAETGTRLVPLESLPRALADPFEALFELAKSLAPGDRFLLTMPPRGYSAPAGSDYTWRELRRRLPSFVTALGLRAPGREVGDQARFGPEMADGRAGLLLEAPTPSFEEHSVSVIVPVRNEEKNLRPLLSRLPSLAAREEIVIVESGSRDRTWEEAQSCARAATSRRPVRAIQARELGKAPAVRLAMQDARHDLLVILDGDVSVAPEELTRVVWAMTRGGARFVNGSRSFYQKQAGAMPGFNQAANELFPWLWRVLHGVTITDSLCGTKGFRREDVGMLLAEGRWFFDGSDPFGDFDLIYSSVALGHPIAEVPLHYYARTYGSSNIQRWRSGWMLLKLIASYRRRVARVRPKSRRR